MTHSRNPGYIPGDYWMTCDLCGFHYRRSQMRERWDKAWVCLKDWEPRHPQDFVKAIKERINVPVARPDGVDFTNSTTLTVAASKGDLTITVVSVTGIADGDSIGILLDDSTIHWTTVNGTPAALIVSLDEALSGDAASGKTVYIPGDSLSNPVTSTAGL